MSSKKSNSTFVKFGYVCAFMPILMLPIVFTPLAVLFGIINLLFDEELHGIVQVIIGISLGLIGSYIGGPGLGLPPIRL